MARSEPMSPTEYRRWRFYAESLIEQAITILDTIDGNADLEEGGDGEPSLASPGGGDSQIIWCAGADDDREWSISADRKDRRKDCSADSLLNLRTSREHSNGSVGKVVGRQVHRLKYATKSAT